MKPHILSTMLLALMAFAYSDVHAQSGSRSAPAPAVGSSTRSAPLVGSSVVEPAPTFESAPAFESSPAYNAPEFASPAVPSTNYVPPANVYSAPAYPEQNMVVPYRSSNVYGASSGCYSPANNVIVSPVSRYRPYGGYYNGGFYSRPTTYRRYRSFGGYGGFGGYRGGCGY